MNNKCRAHYNFFDWWSLGLGLGLLKAPGTMGSLLGIPLALAIHTMPPWIAGLSLGILTWISWDTCLRTYKKLGNIDHPAIVSDEVVGVIWAFIGIPLSGLSLLTGFVLFRVFDIAKPWPISYVDQQSSWCGHEVMLDDLIAGLAANILLRYLFL